MRMYKFRGLFDEEKWVYGMYVDGHIVNGVVEATDEYIAMENWCPVDVDTVGQYTGFKDKNGVEIYEDDTLEFKFKAEKGTMRDIGVVEMSECGFWIVKIKSIDNFDPLCDWLPDAKIIGNIYEDVELLGEGK